MNKDTVKGAVVAAMDKIQQTIGRLMGSPKQEAKGIEKRAAGKTRKAAGKTRATVKRATATRKKARKAKHTGL